MTNKMIYIHIPFCDSKCYYCNFCSGVYGDKTKEEYFENLILEIKNSSNKNTTISSIFIGGGTPSSVSKKYIEQIIETIKNCFNVNQNAEITIEANPCSVTLDKLQKYKEIGINRISFGVQSLDEKCLKLIGRKHTSKQAINAIKLAKIAGFTNISCDVLIGIPNQTYRILKNTVKTLLKQEITHISCYMLINEDGTLLTKQIKENKVEIVDDDKCVKFYNKLNMFLSQKNFFRYEISNFSKIGYECKHNCGYWDLTEYYGFGLSAHGFIDGRRYENVENINKYLHGEFCNNVETLSNNEIIEELIMLGLRTKQGVSVKRLKDFGYDIFKNKNETLQILKNNGFIDYNKEFIFITKDYFGICNNIILKLLP